MVYDPAAESTYEGPLPDARGTKVHARGPNHGIAKIAAKKLVDGKQEAVEAPSAATIFRTSMAAMHAHGCLTFVEMCLFFCASSFGLVFSMFRLIFVRLILKGAPALGNIK